MQISKEGLALIKEFEGFSAIPYTCSGGKLTIGYGHVILSHEEYLHQGITEETAEILLSKDVVLTENTINQYVVTTLNQPQFDALVSFIYNVGAVAFSRSTLLKRINEGDLPAAAQQFHRWVYAAGKKLPGLKRRRLAESSLFSKKIEV